MDSKKYSRAAGETGSVIFLVCSAVLFLGAVGIMIWLLVDAAEDHMVKNVLYGSAFLAVTAGVLLYSVFAFRAPRFSTAALWTAMVLGVATFVVGLCIEPARQRGVSAHVVALPPVSN